MADTDIEAPTDVQPSLAERLALAARAEYAYPAERFAGRGIVICAGGARLFTCAWVMIAMLRRHLGCSLPIEVWHLGPDEIGPPMRALLADLGTHCVDALQVARQHRVDTLGGWQLKTYALLHTRFQHVLLLDADNLPITDPDFLFDTPEYQDRGAMFWPDIVRLRAANHIWAISGLAPDNGPSFESGQVLIDKQRHWQALNLADWINQHHRQFEDMLYGDKDAFYVAWHMVAQPFHFIAHPPRQLDHALCQRGPDGKTLFQHRGGAKWLLQGSNPRVEGFRLEEQCFDLLAELRLLWDGTIFNPPPRSAQAHAMERSLIATGTFRLIWVLSHERDITLGGSHRITEGAARLERTWFVADGGEGLELHIVGAGRLTCALRLTEDGVWQGVAGGVAVALRPLQTVAAQDISKMVEDAPWLVVTRDMLAAAACLSAGSPAGRDATIALASLAAHNHAACDVLRQHATGGVEQMRLVASSALAHLASAYGEAAPMPSQAGTGWQSASGIIEHQSESIRRR